ncbi:MAG: tetratricopeptide repeat protein [Acidobacteriota bacterium]
MLLLIYLFAVVWIGTNEDFLLVERLIGSGQYREALAELETISPSPPGTARWHLLASKAFDGLDDPTRAVEHAEAALALELKNEAHHLQLAQIFLSRNTPLAAYEILSEAQQLFPDSVLISLGKGIALKELKRYEEAEKELVEVLRRKPDLGLAFDALGTVYLNTARYQDLLRVAADYCNGSPNDFRGHYYLAAARHSLNMDPAESEGIVREAIRLNASFAASQALLGKILVDRERFVEAIPVLERAIALRSDYTPAHLSLIKAYRKVGEERKAEWQSTILRELNEKAKEPPAALLYHRKQRSP